MATRDSTQARPVRGNYHTPPSRIRLVPGVVKTENGRSDTFVGTAEALVAAGVVTLDQLPGQPGRPAVAVNFRPNGMQRPAGASWFQLCGYMSIRRRTSTNDFVVVLNVPEEEYARRRAVVQRRESAAEAAAESVLKELPPSVRSYCNRLLTFHGRFGAEQRFRDPVHLARLNISPATAVEVLSGFEVFALADIERRLMHSSMNEALAVLASVAGRPIAPGSEVRHV